MTMPRTGRGLAAVLVLVTPLLGACSEAVFDTHVNENEPGSVEPIEGTDLGRVTLTEDAIERVGVRTGKVTKSAKGLVVSSAAVFVDTEGAWWVYTNPTPQVYVRHEIDIAREANGKAFLASGPAAGTAVVTVGVPEIYGVEAGVDH